MQKALLALLLGSALVLGACGNNEKSTTGEAKTTDTTASEGKTTKTSVDGEKITKEKCISCHGNDLTGAMGPDLTKVGSKLSEDDIKDILNKGKGQMPAKPANGLQSDEEVNAVAKWLSEQK